MKDQLSNRVCRRTQQTEEDEAGCKFAIAITIPYIVRENVLMQCKRPYSMIESSITVKGQTTLPKAVRDSLAVKAGDKVRYVILDEGVLIMPVRPTSRLFRSLKYDGPTVSLEDMDRAIAEGAIDG